jgi:acetyl esterase/lipase
MRDISYASRPRCELDIYTPHRVSHSTVITFFCGGGWQRGQKGWYRILASTFTLRDYLFVIPDYRLYPEAKFPEFPTDASDAWRWTKHNIGQFGGDQQNIFVMGHSAGAYIAAMIAFDPQWLAKIGHDADSEIAGLIGVAGPYDFLPLTDAVLIDMFGGADRPETQPISFAHGRTPSTLFLAGDIDNVVDPGNSVRLANKLQKYGNQAKAAIYPRLGHISILAGFAPGLERCFPAMGHVSAFIEGVRVARSASPISSPRAAQ